MFLHGVINIENDIKQNIYNGIYKGGNLPYKGGNLIYIYKGGNLIYIREVIALIAPWYCL